MIAIALHPVEHACGPAEAAGGDGGVSDESGTDITKTAVREQITHRWYTRPGPFVADVNRALRFYIDKLGFEKNWHEGDGAGGVRQVNRARYILCEDATRRDKARCSWN